MSPYLHIKSPRIWHVCLLVFSCFLDVVTISSDNRALPQCLLHEENQPRTYSDLEWFADWRMS